MRQRSFYPKPFKAQVVRELVVSLLMILQIRHPRTYQQGHP